VFHIYLPITSNFYSVIICCNFFPKNNISVTVLGVFIIIYNQILYSLHNELSMNIKTEHLNILYIVSRKSHGRMKEINSSQNQSLSFQLDKQNNFYVLSQELKEVNTITFCSELKYVVRFFCRAKFLSDARLKFEETPYLHCIADSIFDLKCSRG
jgi:hypothetical protein